MNVDHIIFLIHPCCYEPIPAQQIKEENLQLFLDRERELKAQWLDELTTSRDGTLLWQLGGPQALRDEAIARLGAARVFYPTTPFPDNADLDEYYRRLVTDFGAHLIDNQLELEPACVTSELWGESFEGCVPGYGGAFAQYLGLAKRPRMRFEMTVYDSRFLCGAGEPEVIEIAGTDVEAWLFPCHDSTAAAMFQARQTAQWIDERQVQIELNDRQLQICDKRGHTLWPEAPWEKGRPESVRTYGMMLKDCIWRWVRSIGMPLDQFREVIAAARVDGERPESEWRAPLPAHSPA